MTPSESDPEVAPNPPAENAPPVLPRREPGLGATPVPGGALAPAHPPAPTPALMPTPPPTPPPAHAPAHAREETHAFHSRYTHDDSWLFGNPAVAAAASTAATAASAAATSPDTLLEPRKSHRGLVVTGFVLAGLVIAALTLGVVYLWDVHSAYVAQNEALRTEAAAMGDTLSAERITNADQAATIAELQSELDEAKVAISDIVNSEAHAGDDVQTLSDLMTNMIECADARQELVNHLWEQERWTTSSLRANETSLIEYCNNVKRLYAEFKAAA